MYNSSFVLSFLEIDDFISENLLIHQKLKKKKNIFVLVGGYPLSQILEIHWISASSHVIGYGPGCVWVMLFDCNVPLDVINSHGGYGS